MYHVVESEIRQAPWEDPPALRMLARKEQGAKPVGIDKCHIGSDNKHSRIGSAEAP
jgi:hypothetical protein